MRFDRGVRNSMMRPYPSGYTVASTDGFNKEKADCSMGGVKDPGVWLTEKAFPSLIELQVKLTPVWVDDETASAQLGDHAPCILYPPQSVFSHVIVEAAGVGGYQKTSGEEKIPFVGTNFLGYTLVLPKPFLYQKNFHVQPEGRNIQAIEGRQTLLWAYGAQQVGEDIHPFAFTLEPSNNETFLQGSSLLFWREKGIHPLQEEGNGETAFQDAFEEDQTRTLFESVEAGMSEIDLEAGVDEKGIPLKIPYVSCQLSKNTIFYKRKGEI